MEHLQVETSGKPNTPPGPQHNEKAISLCQSVEHEMGHLQHCDDKADSKPLGDCSLPFKDACQNFRCEVLAYSEEMDCCFRKAKKPEGCAADAKELCKSMFLYCFTYKDKCADDTYYDAALKYCNSAWTDVCKAILAPAKRESTVENTTVEWDLIDWGGYADNDTGVPNYPGDGDATDFGSGVWDPPQCCEECEPTPTPTPTPTTTPSPTSTPLTTTVYPTVTPTPTTTTVYHTFTPLPTTTTVYPTYTPSPTTTTVYPTVTPMSSPVTEYTTLFSPSSSPAPTPSFTPQPTARALARS